MKYGVDMTVSHDPHEEDPLFSNLGSLVVPSPLPAAVAATIEKINGYVRDHGNRLEACIIVITDEPVAEKPNLFRRTWPVEPVVKIGGKRSGRFKDLVELALRSVTNVPLQYPLHIVRANRLYRRNQMPGCVRATNRGYVVRWKPFQKWVLQMAPRIIMTPKEARKRGIAPFPFLPIELNFRR